LLSVLSVLAEDPDRIRKLFSTDQINPQGMYGINMVKNGQSQTVIIDECIPCSAGEDGEPSFSKGNGPELWVLFIEKAWAKIHGSYERIAGGDAAATFRDLTGAPTFSVKTEEEDCFSKIEEAYSQEWVIAAGTISEEGDEAKLKELGLVNGHEYGIL
jgi:calpain-15